MFCHKCGTELPDDSQFCRKCGNALVATTTTPLPTTTATGAAAAPARAQVPAQPKHSIAIYFLVPLLVLCIIWLASTLGKKPYQTNAFPSQRPPQPVPHTQVITNTALTVTATGATYYRFLVPPGADNVRVDGRFSATGGSGNDVEAYVLGEDAFVNWQNGHSGSAYYNSGRVTQSNIYASLPSGGGTYYVVFNNKFSFMTPKAVQASVVLHYTTTAPPQQ